MQGNVRGKAGNPIDKPLKIGRIFVQASHYEVGQLNMHAGPPRGFNIFENRGK